MSAPARVSDLLAARVDASPDHVALVVDGGQSLTYRQWDRHANAAARGLTSLGVTPGDRVGLLFDNPWWTDYATCYLGALKAGAVAVPLSPRFSAPEREHVIGHAGINVVVAPPELSFGPAVTPLELVADRSEAPLGTLADPPGLAEVIYTSGTTGTPKGVAITHSSLLAHDLPPAPPSDPALLHAFPIGTNAGQECLRMPLRRRLTAVVLPTFDPERLCAVVAERRITRLQLVPSMAQLVVASGAPARHDVSSVERITLSSAPAPAGLWAELAAAFPGAELYNAYALTEGGGARTMMRHDPARPHAVGRPVGETEVRVVDAGGSEAPVGATGEIWLRRPGAPRREYYRDPEATAAAYASDWLRTGDLGFIDGDGYLNLVDRSKDIIISGGFNVSSVEVEDALYAHPAVREAAVFGVPHPILGQDVAAAVVPGEPVDERELQSFVRARLGEHKVPHRLVLVDDLPRTASGKVVKRELRERFGREPAEAPVGTGTTPATAATGAAVTTPSNGAEAAVLAIWRDVLGREDIGVHDDFYDLGGHSLAATQIAARLRDAFAVDVPLAAVFDHPTVAELAAVVVSGASALASP